MEQETTAPINSFKPMLYGVYNGLAVCAFILLEFLLGFHNSNLQAGQYSSYFSMLIPLFFLSVGIASIYKSSAPGKFKFMHGLQFGLFMSMFSSIVLGLFTYVYNHFINPGWMYKAALWQIEKLKREGAALTQIEIMEKQLQYANNVGAQVLNAMVGVASTGIFLAAIVSIFFVIKDKRRL